MGVAPHDDPQTEPEYEDTPAPYARQGLYQNPDGTWVNS